MVGISVNFPLLSSIPLYRLNNNLCVFSHVDGHLDCFTTYANITKNATYLHVQVFVWTYILISLEKNVEVEWLGHMLSVCLT